MQIIIMIYGLVHEYTTVHQCSWRYMEIKLLDNCERPGLSWSPMWTDTALTFVNDQDVSSSGPCYISPSHSVLVQQLAYESDFASMRIAAINSACRLEDKEWSRGWAQWAAHGSVLYNLGCPGATELHSLQCETWQGLLSLSVHATRGLNQGVCAC